MNENNTEFEGVETYNLYCIYIFFKQKYKSPLLISSVFKSTINRKVCDRHVNILKYT